MKYKIVKDREDFDEFEDTETREAIFDTETGQQISKWWQYIYKEGLVEGRSEYYRAVRIKEIEDDIVGFDEVRQEAIFHKDNPDKPVTKWWDEIQAQHR